MATQTFALIDTATDILVNAVVVDVGDGWTPPEGTREVPEQDILTYQWSFDENTWSWVLLSIAGLLIIGSFVDSQNQATPPGVDPNTPPPIPPHPSTDQPVAEGAQSL